VLYYQKVKKFVKLANFVFGLFSGAILHKSQEVR